MAKFRLIQAASYRVISKRTGKLYTFVGQTPVSVTHPMDVDYFQHRPDAFEEVTEEKAASPVEKKKAAKQPRSYAKVVSSKKKESDKVPAQPQVEPAPEPKPAPQPEPKVESKPEPEPEQEKPEQEPVPEPEPEKKDASFTSEKVTSSKKKRGRPKKASKKSSKKSSKKEDE